MFASTPIAPNKHFETNLIVLAQLAEAFRKIESLFMTDCHDPEFLLKLCTNVLNSKAYSIPAPKRTPTCFINIKYYYSENRKDWIEERKDEECSPDKWNNRIVQLCHAIEKCRTSHSALMTAYFTRQKEFYESIVSGNSKINFTHYVSPYDALNTLIVKLKPFNNLLCLTPDIAIEKIERLIAETSKTNLTETTWMNMAVILFTGRDILAPDDNQALHPQVKAIIPEIISACKKALDEKQEAKEIAAPKAVKTENANSKVEISMDEYQEFLAFKKAASCAPEPK